MEPSNTRLLEEVIRVLDERIAPAVRHDQWAASELRSIGAVLALVYGRLQHGDSFLRRDNARLSRLLSDLGAPGADPAPTAASDLVSGGQVTALNIHLRAAVEDLLPGLHDGGHAEQLDALHRCLLESALDEEAVYGPLGERRPF